MRYILDLQKIKRKQNQNPKQKAVGMNAYSNVIYMSKRTVSIYKESGEKSLYELYLMYLKRLSSSTFQMISNYQIIFSVHF